MNKLISMTQRVLEVEKYPKDSTNWTYLHLEKLFLYASFLVQKLELWMFIPCKLVDGVWVALEQPTHYDEWESEFKRGIEHLYEGLIMKEYQKAKERVLFEGFKKQYNAIISPCGGYFDSSKTKNRTIESIIDLNLTLTPNSPKTIRKMKALSIKQPWGHLICTPRKDNPLLGIKDIENRTWKTHFRGRLYIHASAKIMDVEFTGKQIKALSENNINYSGAGYPNEWKTVSAIIGEVDIIDCVVNHHSIWAEKTEGKYVGDGVFVLSEKPIYNWVLANPVLYEKPILNVKGKLSFWEFEKPEESEFCECSKPNQSLFPDGTYKCINKGCFKTWYH